MKKKKIISMLCVFALLINMVQVMANVKEAKAENYGISNPRIDDDGTVTWDKVQFGSYKQDATFEKEPIKWRILSVNEDGTDAFIMADKALDCKNYNEVSKSVTWETCTLRRWLNTEFLNEAFSTAEQTAIKATTVVNNDNPSYGAEGGNNTTDKIYLLSIEEANNKEYGFYADFSNSCNARSIEASDYASINGAFTDDDRADYARRRCGWWMRSPGYGGYSDASSGFYGACMNCDGKGGNAYGMEDLGVCPTLHINLSSSLIKDAGEVDSYGNVTTSDDGYSNPRVDVIGTKTTWDCIYFGNYMQNAVIEKKPIEWRVLSVNGNDAFLLSDKGLDCQRYNKIDKSITWETCTLRTWLNNDFINNAFNDDEKKAIIETTVINDNNPTYNIRGGNNTLDKIYLLSLDEVGKQNYGFEPVYDVRGDNRYYLNS